MIQFRHIKFELPIGQPSRDLKYAVNTHTHTHTHTHAGAQGRNQGCSYKVESNKVNFQGMSIEGIEPGYSKI